jgi:hypothetical protein
VRVQLLRVAAARQCARNIVARAQHASGGKLTQLDNAGARRPQQRQPLDDACSTTKRVAVLLCSPQNDAKFVVAFDDMLLQHTLDKSNRACEE